MFDKYKTFQPELWIIQFDMLPSRRKTGKNKKTIFNKWRLYDIKLEISKVLNRVSVSSIYQSLQENVSS